MEIELALDDYTDALWEQIISLKVASLGAASLEEKLDLDNQVLNAIQELRQTRSLRPVILTKIRRRYAEEFLSSLHRDLDGMIGQDPECPHIGS